MIEEFVAQYYSAAPSIPRLVVVGEAVRERTRACLPMPLPSGGAARSRCARPSAATCAASASWPSGTLSLALKQDKLRSERRRSQRVDAVAALQEALRMDTLPIRIEGFDISNIGGEHTVASMVVFEGGAPEEVRLPALPDPRGPHGRARRLRLDERGPLAPGLAAGRAADRSPHDAERDESFASMPDLIMIDGGKGQLSAGMKAIGTLTDRGVIVISLAKRLEEIYVPGRSAPLEIRPDSPASHLLQRVRDEAHRFAIDFHRNRRDKAMTRSLLDELRGVGPARKRALMSHFGSPERIVAATREEIEAVPGIPGKIARDIHRQLNKSG